MQDPSYDGIPGAEIFCSKQQDPAELIASFTTYHEDIAENKKQASRTEEKRQQITAHQMIVLQHRVDKLSNYDLSLPKKEHGHPIQQLCVHFRLDCRGASLRGVSCRLLSTEMERAKFCATQSCDSIGGHGRT